MSIKRRYHLRKASLKQLTREVAEKFGVAASEFLNKAIEVAELNGGEHVIMVDGEAFLFRSHGGLSPVLKALDRITLKRVVVDMGAVPHVVNGADIMAPGVVSADDDIVQDEDVVIVDERHGKPLAVGRALVPGAAMRGPRGKVVENLHHVGDEIWRFQAKG